MHDSLAANLDTIFNLYVPVVILAFGLVLIGGPWLIISRRLKARDRSLGKSAPMRKRLTRVALGVLVYVFALAGSFFDDALFTGLVLAGPLLLVWGVVHLASGREAAREDRT